VSSVHHLTIRHDGFNIMLCSVTFKSAIGLSDEFFVRMTCISSLDQVCCFLQMNMSSVLVS